MINVFPPLCNIISLNLNDFRVLLVAVHLFLVFAYYHFASIKGVDGITVLLPELY